MVYYTTKCPNCHDYLKFHSTSKTSEGCPFKTCPHCGKPYIDMDCYEQALKPFSPDTTGRLIGLGIFTGLFISFLCTMVYSAICYFSENEHWFTLAGAGIVFGVSLFIFLPLILIKFINSKASGNKEMLAEWKASEHRLKDPEYANKLKELGFKVPEIYLMQPTCQGGKSSN